MDIYSKIEHAHKIIEKSLSITENPFVAYSGGKDGFIVAHMVSQHLPNIKMACEISHTFKAVVEDIKSIANEHNFNVEYKNSLSAEWLLKNSKYIFTSDGKLIKQYCSSRQQKMLRKFQKENGYDCTFTGRTKYDNNVKAEIYNTKRNGIQSHPIRNFKDEDVWEYFKINNLRIPMIYNTKFGEKTGNSPFFAMGYKNKGLPISKAWEAVNEIDKELIFYNKFKDSITRTRC
jgi:3'-phosphoadenosine 5'-phosphosulfate sulfotransferase (PAPS reductase)/FAD synthetase